MQYVTHLAMGLIIGQVSDNYTAALVGSFVIDLDHLPLLMRSRTLFDLKKFLRSTFEEESEAYGNERGILHGLPSWFLCSLPLLFIDTNLALTFSGAYLAHLFLDAVDGANFYPFAPSRLVSLKGPIPYASWQELIFGLGLFVVFYVVWSNGVTFL